MFYGVQSYEKTRGMQKKTKNNAKRLKTKDKNACFYAVFRGLRALWPKKQNVF